jgi:hypothetical protein
MGEPLPTLNPSDTPVSTAKEMDNQLTTVLLSLSHLDGQDFTVDI